MKIYYYEYSDDGEVWRIGEVSRYYSEVLDKAEEQPYRWRIKYHEIEKENSKEVLQEQIEEDLNWNKLCKKLFNDKN